MQKQLNIILLMFGILALVYSQEKDSYNPDIIKQSIIKEFNNLHGEGWHFNWNLNNTPHRIFGQFIPHDFDANDPID